MKFNLLKKIFLVIEVFSLLVYLKFFLKLYSFQSLLQLIKSNNFKFLFNNNLHWNIEAIKVTSALIPNYSCLLGSSALKIISSDLENVRLIIGISKKDNFKSHAWIEINKEIILGKIKDIISFKPIIVI